MKRRFLLSVIVSFFAVGAVADFFALIPKPEKMVHAEEAGKDFFPDGTLLFSAQDKKTKAIFLNYETRLTPQAALEGLVQVMILKGYSKVFATQSMVIFENSDGKCAAIQAYEKDMMTIASVIMQ